MKNRNHEDPVALSHQTHFRKMAVLQHNDYATRRAHLCGSGIETTTVDFRMVVLKMAKLMVNRKW